MKAGDHHCWRYLHTRLGEPCLGSAPLNTPDAQELTQATASKTNTKWKEKSPSRRLLGSSWAKRLQKPPQAAYLTLCRLL